MLYTRIQATPQLRELVDVQSDLACSTSTNGADAKSHRDPKAHGYRPGS